MPNIESPKIEVGQFVRFVDKHPRSEECGTVVSINGRKAEFKFHFDGLVIPVPLKDLSTDTLVGWGL